MYIKINQLNKTYQQQSVVDIPALSLQQGEITGILGPNGAGKTTLFNMILDLVPADSGEIIINNIPISAADDYKAQIGSYLDENFLIDFLTPQEYFSFQAQLRNWDKKTLEAYLQRWEPIFDGEVLEKKKYIRDLSKGNKSKVGIAAALIGYPKLVILDEPFANVDPGAQIRLIQLIKDFKVEFNITFIISSHDLRQVTKLCERLLILQKGKLIQDIVTTDQSIEALEAHFIQD